MARGRAGSVSMTGEPMLRVEQVPIERLRPDPANPGRRSEEELDSLERSWRHLFETPIRNHLRSGEALYEPFCGSGIALVAAERAGVRPLCDGDRPDLPDGRACLAELSFVPRRVVTHPAHNAAREAMRGRRILVGVAADVEDLVCHR